MKQMKKYIIALMVLFAIGTFGCGRVIEQNELALVLKTIGERSPEAINVNQELADSLASEIPEAQADSVYEVIADNFVAELITATRAPLERPGIKILVFPLGLQVYKFSKNPSIESPDNDAIIVDAIGGQVTFELVVHLYIDRTFPDLKERLVQLMKSYQLRRYSGSPDVLAKLVEGRFRKILKQPFIEYCANRQVLDIIRTKSAMNAIALREMNERFNPLGLRFTLVAVSSATEVPVQQQRKMNEIFLQDVTLQTLTLKNGKVLPLVTRIDSLVQSGITDSLKIVNEARASEIRLVTAAEKARKATFVELVGKQNTVELETMLNMVNSLEMGKTEMEILPKDSQISLFRGPFVPTNR